MLCDIAADWLVYLMFGLCSQYWLKTVNPFGATSVEPHPALHWLSCCLSAIQDMWVGGVIQNWGLKCHTGLCLKWVSEDFFWHRANTKKTTTKSNEYPLIILCLIHHLWMELVSSESDSISLFTLLNVHFPTCNLTLNNYSITILLCFFFSFS